MSNHGSAPPEKNLAGRISVLRDRHLVPLLASTQPQASPEQPWKGILLESHLVRPGEIPQHEHPDLCLHLQLTGHDKFEWWSSGRNSIEPTRPGSLILIPPGTSDRLRWEGSSQRIILSVAPAALASLATELGSPRTPEFRTQWSLQDPALQRLVAEMGNEAHARWPLGALYADLLAIGLQSRLLRTHATESHQLPALKGSLSLPRLRCAMEYINANIAEDLHLEAIAGQLDLSPSHFAHEFRNSTGQTPYQYLLDQRMAKAQDLLKRTNLPVQYISAAAGFRSPVNFVRAFRQRIGQTPAAWRKNS